VERWGEVVGGTLIISCCTIKIKDFLDTDLICPFQEEIFTGLWRNGKRELPNMRSSVQVQICVVLPRPHHRSPGIIPLYPLIIKE